MAIPLSEEYLIQIGGRVVEAANPEQGVPLAKVTMLETGKTVMADSRGFYSLARLPRGTYTLEALAKNFKPNKREIEVPAPDGDYYIHLNGE